MKKIFSDDPIVPYKYTKVDKDRTKTQIDGILAEYGIKDVAWHNDPEHNNVFIEFTIEEEIEGIPIKAIAKVQCPTIWDKAGKRGRKPEQINWRISFRVLHWYIKTHLEMAYLLRSRKVTAFLPDIKAGAKGETVAEILVPQLDALRGIHALPEPKKELKKNETSKIIDV